jgi:hypothetical protein
LDFSLARSFRVSLGDRAGYLQLRADAYNALNHSNLNNPNVDDGSAFVGNSNFGFANYGRSSESGGPLQLLPLAETRRQIQLALRFSF